MSPGTIEGIRLYQPAFGFVSAVDLSRGTFVWRHRGLYDRRVGAFNSFESPEVGPREVVFTESIDSGIPRKPRTILVDKMSGTRHIETPRPWFD